MVILNVKMSAVFRLWYLIELIISKYKQFRSHRKQFLKIKVSSLVYSGPGWDRPVLYNTNINNTGLTVHSFLISWIPVHSFLISWIFIHSFLISWIPVNSFPWVNWPAQNSPVHLKYWRPGIDRKWKNRFGENPSLWVPSSASDSLRLISWMPISDFAKQFYELKFGRFNTRSMRKTVYHFDIKVISD